MLLVDDHEAQLGQGSEHRQARADHHPGATGLGVAPGPQAFAVGQVAVQRGQRHVGEAGTEARDQLRGEVDLRDQDERLAPAGQHLGDYREVDLGLAAARHAPQEEGCKATQHIEDRAHTLRLIRRERRAGSGIGQLARDGASNPAQAAWTRSINPIRSSSESARDAAGESARR